MAVPSGGQNAPEPSSSENYTLAEALLAPLDAIFKAQIHAARSFINLLLQLGFPHQPVDEEGNPLDRAAATPEAQIESKLPYTIDFYRRPTGGTDDPNALEKVSIPVLALIPVAPLGVDSAEFHFEMEVKRFDDATLMQQSEVKTLNQEAPAFREKARPWYLVRRPITFKGEIAPKSSSSSSSSSSSRAVIDIQMKIARLPVPAGLDRFLRTLSNETTEAISKAPTPEQRAAQNLPNA
jgi:hypothetical protein